MVGGSVGFYATMVVAALVARPVLFLLLLLLLSCSMLDDCTEEASTPVPPPAIAPPAVVVVVDKTWAPVPPPVVDENRDRPPPGRDCGTRLWPRHLVRTTTESKTIPLAVTVDSKQHQQHQRQHLSGADTVFCASGGVSCG